MDFFNGVWIDEAKVEIKVSGSNNHLEVKYSNGRGPFHGLSIQLAQAVINVDFTDDKPFTGVASVSGDLIYWANGTTWRRK
ncbi:hypothetical protein H2O64_08150 [Kordia sp. YSTF-M3]|uniref:DUF1080 domain-containing protein n=1 Tax=Kordia aestuariivivens TaxID=2759037 RepID=A0ABR7Q879_9FLAO|nr:hypothetical protein [Kordia aestuariivivens]MBC8754643.1 hypothetical protein [Kordia aestuariivivens]